MDQKEKENVKQNVYSFSSVYNFVSPEELPSNPNPGDTATVKFSMFRTGKFDHPWYGELNFDKDYLSKIVNNFENDTLPSDIALNLDHDPSSNGQGATAWLKDIKLSEGKIQNKLGTKNVTFLEGVWELNSLGILMVKDKRFLYSSAEINPEFTTHEKHNVEKDEDGNPKSLKEGSESSEDTAILSHGPTLTGCALTNSPFIPSLGKVVNFSNNIDEENDCYITMSGDENTGIKYFSYTPFEKEDIKTYSFGTGDTQEELTFPYDGPDDDELIKDFPGLKDISKDKREQWLAIFEDTINEDESNIEEAAATAWAVINNNTEESNDSKEFNKTTGDTMEFSEVLSQARGLESLKEKIEFLKSKKQSFSDEQGKTEVLNSLIEDYEEAQSEIELAKETVNEAVQKKQKAEKEAQKFKSKTQKMQIELAEAREGRWQTRVKNFCNDLRNEQGHHESVVKEIEHLFSNLKEDARSFKFSFADDDTDELNVIEMFSRVLQQLPESARFDESENLEANKQTEVVDEKQVDPNGKNEQDFTSPKQKEDEEQSYEELARQAYIERYNIEPDERYIENEKIDPETGLLKTDFLSFGEQSN